VDFLNPDYTTGAVNFRKCQLVFKGFDKRILSKPSKTDNCERVRNELTRISMFCAGFEILWIPNTSEKLYFFADFCFNLFFN